MPGRSSRAASTAGELLGQALEAGRDALKEAQRRLPPDWRHQVETRVTEAMRPFQAQLKSRARQSDLDELARRVDELADRVEKLSRAAAPAQPPAARAPRRPSVRKPPGGEAAESPAPESAAARRARSR